MNDKHMRHAGHEQHLSRTARDTFTRTEAEHALLQKFISARFLHQSARYLGLNLSIREIDLLNLNERAN